MIQEISDSIAYIGPGLSGGVIGIIIGVLTSIFLAIVAIFWYPIKRMLGIKKKKPAATEAVANEPPQTTQTSTPAESDANANPPPPKESA